MKRFVFTLSTILLTAGLITGCGTKEQTQPAEQPPAEQPAADSGQASKPAEQTAPANKKQYNQPPDMQIDPNKQYTATISTTKGDFKVKLFAKETPTTVNNFVFLAKDDFYDGVIFHRVIKDFMIQTGDPEGTGGGGPGYVFVDELGKGFTYKKGVVAMANRGPNTNGSQFFIGSGKEVENLNGMPNYTIFGEVVEGIETVDAIASVPVSTSAMGEQSAPDETIKINDVTIEEK